MIGPAGAELEARQIGYVLAVACDHPVGFGGVTCRADGLLRQVPARAWQQISCGKGAKGHRYYDWAFIRLDHPGPGPGEQAGRHWLMVRRNRRTGELAFYRCFTPRPVPLAVLVRVAGRRWTQGRGLPGRQGPLWPGPAPGPPLAPRTCTRRWSLGPLAIATTDCTGQYGDVDIRHAPAPATTDDKPPLGNHEDQALWLAY